MPSIRRALLASAASVAMTISACGTESDTQIEGRFLLVRINGQTLPYDHEGLGCCVYLSGQFEFDGSHYTVSITARNRNSGLEFTSMEQGTWSRSGNILMFMTTGYDTQPFLLSTGVVSEDSITVGVGGEGPGAPDQLQMVFLKSGSQG